MHSYLKTEYDYVAAPLPHPAWLLLVAILGVGFALLATLVASAHTSRLPAAPGAGRHIGAGASVSPLPAQGITATATVTPLLQAITVTTTGMATTRSGPGADYPEVATFAPGLTFDATGRSSDSQWLLIALSQWLSVWVPANLVVSGGEVRALAEASPPERSAAATPAITDKPVISARTTSGANNGIILSVSGLTPGRYYTVQIVNQKGKTVFKRGATAREDGYLGFINNFSSVGVSPLNYGTYSVTVYLEGVPIGSKQFTLSKP
jgi:uncharacterized protein YraI